MKATALISALLLLSGCACQATWFHRCAPDMDPGPLICYERGTEQDIADRHGVPADELWRLMYTCPAWTARMCPTGTEGRECRAVTRPWQGGFIDVGE